MTPLYRVVTATSLAELALGQSIDRDVPTSGVVDRKGADVRIARELAGWVVMVNDRRPASQLVGDHERTRQVHWYRQHVLDRDKVDGLITCESQDVSRGDRDVWIKRRAVRV